jgi:hypothetical protein
MGAGYRYSSIRRARCGACWSLAAGAAGLVVIQAAVWLGLELAPPGFTDPEYAVRSRVARALIAEHPNWPVAVALGSSRTEMGLAPAEAAHGLPVLIFNFAQEGAGPAQQLVCLQRLLAEGARPRLVLIEILPSHYNRDVESLPRDRLDLFDERDLQLLRNYAPPNVPLRRPWWPDRVVPAYTFRGDLLRGLCPAWVASRSEHRNWQGFDHYGWRPSSRTVTPAQRWEYTQRAWHEHGVALRPYRVKPLPDRLLRDLVTAVRAAGAEPVLYLMPEGSEYRSWYAGEPDLALTRYLLEFATQHAVAVVDARIWMADGDFFDSHHLLRPAAEAFSRRFGEEVILPRLIEPRR